MNNLLQNFLDERGRLLQYPAKHKKKLAALAYLATKIDPQHRYTQAQFNDLLDDWHTFHDPATLRRELYNNRFIDRAQDGSVYWLEPVQPQLPEE